MSGLDWVVMIGGVTAIGWINWYFLLSQQGIAVTVIREQRGLDARSPKENAGRS